MYKCSIQNFVEKEIHTAMEYITFLVQRLFAGRFVIYQLIVHFRQRANMLAFLPFLLRRLAIVANVALCHNPMTYIGVMTSAFHFEIRF